MKKYRVVNNFHDMEREKYRYIGDILTTEEETAERLKYIEKNGFIELVEEVEEVETVEETEKEEKKKGAKKQK